MESIITWLKNNGSYTEGLQLYEALPGMKPVLLKNLRNGESLVNMQTLKYELKKASAGFKQPAETIVLTVGPAEKKTEDPAQKNALLFHQLPPDLRPVLLRAQELFRINCMLKTELNELPEEAEEAALEIQLQIFYNFQQNSLCYKKIDYWQEHKVLPGSPSEKFDKLTPEQKVKRQAQLFSSKSKLETRIEINTQLLDITTATKKRAQLQRMIAKQTKNLLQQQESLLKLNAIIDGTNEG